MGRRHDDSGEAFSFVTGLIVGLVVSAPVVAWMSPRSGGELRRGIVQRGVILRRRVGESLRKPLEQVQDQLEQLKGESIQAALEEGRALAARKRHESAM